MKYSIILLICACFIACTPDSPKNPGDPKTPAVPGESPRKAQETKFDQRNRDFLTYMEAEETTPEDLKKISQYGKGILPLLKQTLKEGPSEMYRAQVQEKLSAQYKMLAKTKINMSEAEFTKLYLGNYTRDYQVRAIEILKEIDGGKDVILAYQNGELGNQDAVIMNYIKQLGL